MAKKKAAPKAKLIIRSPVPPRACKAAYGRAVTDTVPPPKRKKKRSKG